MRFIEKVREFFKSGDAPQVGDSVRHNGKLYRIYMASSSRVRFDRKAKVRESVTCNPNDLQRDGKVWVWAP